MPQPLKQDLQHIPQVGLYLHTCPIAHTGGAQSFPQNSHRMNPESCLLLAPIPLWIPTVDSLVLGSRQPRGPGKAPLPLSLIPLGVWLLQDSLFSAQDRWERCPGFHGKARREQRGCPWEHRNVQGRSEWKRCCLEGSGRGNRDPMGFVNLGAAWERREGGKEGDWMRIGNQIRHSWGIS